MILFYVKKTGQIIGTVEGRVHLPEVLEKFYMVPSNFTKEEIGKYVVPFIPLEKEVDEPIYENRITNTETMRVEKVQVGIKKVKKVTELTPDVPFADTIYKFENREVNPLQCSIQMDTKGKVINIA